MIVLSEIIGYNKIQYLNVENHLRIVPTEI